jgi:hypothetical protein
MWRAKSVLHPVVAGICLPSSQGCGHRAEVAAESLQAVRDCKMRWILAIDKCIKNMEARTEKEDDDKSKSN